MLARAARPTTRASPQARDSNSTGTRTLSTPSYAVVLRGTVTHMLGGENTTLRQGDYVVIPPKVNHGWTVDPGGSGELVRALTAPRIVDRGR